jgi:2-polyprenyl-3-methyl-5-hydroxy-6-metoxy-1,4-benzoquinol methylase
MNKAKYNDAKYGNWYLGNSNNSRINQIVRLAGSNKKILDIGCNIGQIGNILIQNHNQVYGIDISKTAIQKAIKNGLVAKICDIENEDIPFKSIKFDIIIGAEIIEHVFDTDAFLQKIRNSLKINGEIIITTPNLATFGRRLLLLVGKNPLIEVHAREHTAGHIRYFIKETLIDLIESNNFKVTDLLSDTVNFTANGSVSSELIAHIIPTMGKSLIVKATRIS